MRSLSWNTVVDFLLLLVVLVTLAFVGYVLYQDVSFEQSLYQKRIASVAASSDSASNAAVLAYLRAYHFAVTKVAALLLGYAVITLGLLYVLRTTKSEFLTSVQASGNVKVILHTASPGLVIVALGTVLVVVALMVKSELIFEAPDSTRRAPDSAVSKFKPAPKEAAAPISRFVFVRTTPQSRTIDRTELDRSLEGRDLGRLGNCKTIVITAVGVTASSLVEAQARRERLQEDVRKRLIDKGVCRDSIRVMSYGEQRPETRAEQEGVKIEILDPPR